MTDQSAERNTHRQPPLRALRWLGRAFVVCIVVAGCHAERVAPPGTLVAELRIGEQRDSSALELTRIRQMVAGKHMLFVTQQGDQEILAFDFQGRHLRTIGRNGAGPGEFDGLESIGLVGDTLWAIDTNLRRISLFRSGDGGLITTMRYESDASLSTAGAGFYYQYPERLLGDGTLLGFGGTAGRMVANGQVTRQPTLRMALSGKVLDTIAWSPLAHQSLIIRGARGGAFYAPQIFSDGSMVEYAPTAQRIYK